MTADFEQLLGYVDGIDAFVDIKKIWPSLVTHPHRSAPFKVV